MVPSLVTSNMLFPVVFRVHRGVLWVVCSFWLSGLSAFIGLISKLVDLIDLSKSKTLPIYLSRELFCL